MQPTLAHPSLSSALGLQIPSHITQRDGSGCISSSVSTSSLSSSGSSTLYGDSDDQLHLSLDTLKFGKVLRSSSVTSSPTGSDCTRNSPRDEDMDIDLDSDHSSESSPISMSYNDTRIPPSVGLYLNTAGSRCTSTPNLHAVNDLLASPVNSPPGSPRMPAVSFAYSSPPSLSIEPARHADEDCMVIVLSPQSSPESSPTLASSPLPLPITLPTRSPRQRVNTPTPTPVSPLVPRALKSSKNRTVNRNSVISLFDSTTSSMTLPTDLARKGTLEVPGALNAKRLSGMFVEVPDSGSSSMTLAEFRLYDVYPKRQRRLLTHMQRLDNRLHDEGVLKKLTKEQLKGKAVILSNIEMAIKDKRPELALQYIALLPPSALKKRKKKGYSELNNCMLLAMIYRMERVAIELVERGFPADVNYPILGRSRDDSWMKPGKKPSFEYPSYFLVAVGLGMGHLVKAMIKNANLNQAWCGLTPLLLATTLNECTNATCPPPTLPPSKLASMLSKGQHVRLDFQSQTLISQLPSSFNKSIDNSPKIPDDAPFPQSIVSMLLEYGADPNLGITLQQYAWANKIKGMGVVTRRKRASEGSPNSEKPDNPIEYSIAAKRLQSGRQWMSSSELKAKKAAQILIQGSTPKKRFSSEMQEYWKGKFIHPVELAIASGNLDSARAIMQRLGPNSLKTSSFGMLLQNDVMLTLSLVKSGCPASQYDIHGCTPLHLAARRGHMEMVMVLLQLGGEVDGQGERQWTPLHESISQNHAAVSSLLVACGADLEVKNSAGETPEELGRRRGLSPEVLASHLDPTKAKDTNAAFLLSFANSMPQGTTTSTGSLSRQSPTVSRQTSYEQLSANTLKSLLMLNTSGDNRQFTFDHNRRSQTFNSILVERSNTSPDSRSSSPTTNSHDSLLETSSGPTRSGSMNNLNVNSDKKKKVRGFLKSIFNK
ncbi:Ankyrin repeat domain-containing protein 46 [Podila minutissima]|nr:Ankyrin repeat domain-containing protein 46 [Podila minutissima]